MSKYLTEQNKVLKMYEYVHIYQQILRNAFTHSP
jgi:hypothetical protein